MTNKTQTTAQSTNTTPTANYGSIRDVLKESALVKEQKLKETDTKQYTLGEIFLHNGRNVQVVELQAEGVYHVKATDAPFDSYWVNTGESTDITSAE